MCFAYSAMASFWAAGSSSLNSLSVADTIGAPMLAHRLLTSRAMRKCDPPDPLACMSTLFSVRKHDQHLELDDEAPVPPSLRDAQVR